MSYLLRLSACLLLCVSLSSFGAFTPTILESRSISQMIDGQIVQREYFIRYPAVQNQTSYPLVLFFHGAGGNGLGMLNPEAENLIDQDEFIGVFPSGFQNRWNVDGETTADDVEFVRLMLNELAVDVRFDIAKVYGIGRSNGAGMVNKLAKETALFTGVAPIASQQLVLQGNMVPLRPVSIFQVNGDNDTVIPLEGGLVFGSKLFLSAQASAENWAASFDCTQTPAVEELDWGDATVQSYLYADCLEGKEVRYLVVEGAGHSMVVGGGFSLYQEIWLFFKTQQAEPIAYTEVPMINDAGFLIMAASLVLLVRSQQLS